ncbi:hypothetical protein AAVH_26477 [Aphelenchoides avenae]|nr:hypothetical protein AAVH_26477 [Aphelenchus avenae]
MCEKMERFLRTDGSIESVHFDVLDTPGVPLKELNGFRRDSDKFVKKVRVGKKSFHVSVQASSQSSATWL